MVYAQGTATSDINVDVSNPPMIVLYDTTLRDGAQTAGVNFSLQDKLAIAKRLSDFGFDYIEGGWPSSNPRDQRFFQAIKDTGLKSKVAAFGMTSKDPPKDKNLLEMIKTGADVLTIVGKSWEPSIVVRDMSDGSVSGMLRKNSQFFTSCSRKGICGSIIKAFSSDFSPSILLAPGQISAHTPHPVQSSGAICTLNFRPFIFFARASMDLNVVGAFSRREGS